MPLTIRSAEAHRIIRELVALTGESATEAVMTALRERIERERLRRSFGIIRDEMQRIREQYRTPPLLDESDTSYHQTGLATG